MATKKTLVEKMSEVMAEIGYVQKDGKNDFHKYKYASAEAVLKKANAALSSRGVAIQSRADLVSFAEGMAVVKVSLAFTDGESQVTCEGLGQGSDKGDKAVMKANTAALKYALANAFMISWGDDPEADSDTDKRAATPASKPKKPAKAKKVSGGSDTETLALLIAGAKSEEDLTKNGVKPKIKALRDTDREAYDCLRGKYQERVKELAGGN